jgi:pseudouridine synthase
MMLERLQKIISRAGISSRRHAEEMILQGRVTVNGKVIKELGTKAEPERDHIKVNGKLINPRQPKTYILLNKPRGYITSLRDKEGRPTVIDLIKRVRTRVYPVGRLDYDTEGLLLLTNDGDLANAVMHPKREIQKTYYVKVKGVLDEKDFEKLRRGIKIEGGITAPAGVKRLKKTDENSWIEMTIHEGKKRQIRRMLERIGHPVLKLKRVKIGFLDLKTLEPGRFRYLTPVEITRLRVITG